MQLNLQDNATISEIYQSVMGQTIKNSLIEIPTATLGEYHSKLVYDLKKYKPEYESDELSNISHLFVKAKTDNAKLHKRNLAFRTKLTRKEEERYSEFYEVRNTESKIEITSREDPTSQFVTNAVEHFGNQFCSAVIGTQKALSKQAETSSLTFQKMLDEGILNSTIEATSFVQHDLPSGGSCYAKEAMLSLHFKKPQDVIIKNACYEFPSMPYSYGEENAVDLTTLRLSPLSTVNAEARASYEITIIKGCSKANWNNIHPDYKGATINQEKDMKDITRLFDVKFTNISITFFKLKDAIFCEDQNTTYDKVDNWIHNPKLTRFVKTYLKDPASTESEIIDGLTLVKVILIKPIKSLAYDIKANISKIEIEIESRAEAFKLLKETVRKTALIQHKLLTEHELVLDLRDTKSNLYGHLFEGICKAITMIVAAQHSISLKCVEGDGNGKYVNDCGVEVTTPEFADAVYIFQKTEKKLFVQYKFSKDEDGLVKLVNDFRMKWKKNRQDLTSIIIVGPKGFNKSSYYQDSINLMDNIVVDAATHQQTKIFLDENVDILTEIAEEYQSLKKAQEDITFFNRKVKYRSTSIERMTAHRDKIKDLDFEEAEKQLSDYENQLCKSTNEKEKIEQKISQILTKKPLFIPGLDDEEFKQTAAKILLKILHKESRKVGHLVRKLVKFEKKQNKKLKQLRLENNI